MTILKDGIEYALGAITIVGFIWQISETKAAMNAKIAETKHAINNKIQELDGKRTEQFDRLEDNLNDKFYLLDKRVDLYIATSTHAIATLEQKHEGATKRLGEELGKTQKRISGAIVFERLENKIDKLNENK